MGARGATREATAAVRRIAAKTGQPTLAVLDELLAILRANAHGGRRPDADVSTAELRKAFLQ